MLLINANISGFMIKTSALYYFLYDYCVVNNAVNKPLKTTSYILKKVIALKQYPLGSNYLLRTIYNKGIGITGHFISFLKLAIIAVYNYNFLLKIKLIMQDKSLIHFNFLIW